MECEIYRLGGDLIGQMSGTDYGLACLKAAVIFVCVTFSIIVGFKEILPSEIPRRCVTLSFCPFVDDRRWEDVNKTFGHLLSLAK